MTPWPTNLLKNWDQCTADEKKLFIRQVDVYAAYLAYTDHEIGRVIQAVEDMGKLDNTLIIYISGDNGSSAEGTSIGTPNEVAHVQRRRVPGRGPVEVLLRRLGHGPDLQPHGRAAGPGRSTRPSAGPSRSPRTSAARAKACASRGPAISRTPGGIRHQFHHIIDVVPTMLEVSGIPAPEVRGRHQAGAHRGHQLRLHLRRGQRRRPLAAQDPVFRDDGRPRHLPRRLDRQHESHPSAVGVAGAVNQTR